MRAVRVDRHGGDEVLRVVDVPEPVVGPGDALIHVTHVGLNHLDVWVRRGVDGHRFPLPLVPGADIVGRRDDTGEWVAVFPATSCMACGACLRGRADLCRAYRIRGERQDGGLQERVAAPAWQLLPLGPLVPHEAAGLPLALLTAWHMLVGRAAGRSGAGPGGRRRRRQLGDPSRAPPRRCCRRDGVYPREARVVPGAGGRRGLGLQ